MSETTREGYTEWHLDKRVPIALITALLVQSATIVWWASNITQRVEGIEKAQTMIVSNQSRIIMLESDQRFTNISLQRIEQKLDRLIERNGNK